MFIYNVKLSGNKLSRIILGFFLVIISILIIFICYTLITQNSFKTNDKIRQNEIFELTTANYTNVLQNVHNNIDSYIGQQIKFTGYIYRLYDFTDEQFVLARNMIISSDFQYVIVGFLCSSSEITKYTDNSWVEIEGEITKGNYHGDIPIIKVNKIEKVDTPSDEYVYPPDNNFVTTSTVL